jgi:uncharacterized protein YegP (UPF0339 family)
MYNRLKQLGDLMKNIYIIGGGTFNHVRNHMALAAPAFGATARELEVKFNNELNLQGLEKEYKINLVLTKMADYKSNLVTNSDIESYVQGLIQNETTKAIIFNVALADFEGSIGDEESGKYAERLKTSNGDITMKLTPSSKIIGQIRKERKDIFVVGFKTTTGYESNAQYIRGLELLKNNSVNLVLANDTLNRNNMIIAPEETRYCETKDRNQVLDFLTKITVSRMQNKFTRSTVIEGDAVDWNSEDVPTNLREVVNHCIKEGAYKPFLGKTAGHFAVKIKDEKILTSIRKTNFNELDKVGLVKVESKNADEVIAHGFRPSVGGQSQRIIFNEHPELDCIVHFHSPVKQEYRDIVIPVTQQWPNECGSHQCGKNTSDHLREVDLDGDKIAVVYLDDHGPNIVFNHTVPAKKVINFIDKHFDLIAKTGGLVN